MVIMEYLSVTVNSSARGNQQGKTALHVLCVLRPCAALWGKVKDFVSKSINF